MKKSLAVVVPILSVCIMAALVLLGFRIGSQPRRAVMEPDPSADTKTAQEEQVVLPELDCPPWS